MTSESPTLLARGKGTVLAVEDEPSLCNLICEVLRSQGYLVLQAANEMDGLAVVNLHAVGPIDLVITDLVMPQMGGPQLAAQLRASWPHIQVLFITGYLEINSPPALSALCGNFIRKPFTPGALLDKVREILETTGGNAGRNISNLSSGSGIPQARS